MSFPRLPLNRKKKKKKRGSGKFKVKNEEWSEVFEIFTNMFIIASWQLLSVLAQINYYKNSKKKNRE